MKHVFLIFLLIVVCFGFTQAGWKQPGGPYGGAIFSIASSSSAVVATDGNDIYVWNAANGWESKYHSPLNLNLVYAYKGTFYAGCNFGIGLLISNDDGETWTRPTDAPGTLVTSFCGTDSAMYLGVFNGVMRSTDNGTTWDQRVTGLTVNVVQAFHDSIYIGAFGGLYLSTDGGATPTLVHGGMPTANVFTIWTDGNTIIAGTDRGPYTSSDRGVSWVGPAVPLRSRFFGTIISRDTTLFASTDIGMFTTGLRSNSWQRISGLCPGAVFNTCFSGDTLLAACGGPPTGAGEGAGIFRSTNFGATWSSESKGLTLLSSTCLLPAANGVMNGTPGAGVYYSSDAGDSWNSRLAGLTGATISGFADAGGVVLAATETGLGVSSDAGQTWTMRSSGLPGGAPLTSILVTDTAWFCGVTGKGVYKSVNAGGAWATSNLGFSTSTITTMLAYDSVIYAGTADRGLYRRKTGQAVWINISSTIASNLFSALGVHGTRLFAGTNGLGLYYSDDHGDHWTAVNFGLPGGTTPIRITGILSQGASVIVSTSDFGVYVSTTNGATWTDVNTGLGNRAVTAIAIRDGILYAGTSVGGVWTRPISEILGVKESYVGTVPEQYTLSDNYPNPFNPETRINYALPVQSYVRLMVYDMLGREVASLVDGIKPAGSYFANFDASRLSSGVYMYSLQTPGFRTVKKMVLVR